MVFAIVGKLLNEIVHDVHEMVRRISGRSEPYTDSFCFLIDIPHHGHLPAFLHIIALIDTDGISPDKHHIWFHWNLSKTLEEILRNLEQSRLLTVWVIRMIHDECRAHGSRATPCI